MNSRLEGIIAPLLTPFRLEDDTVDEAALRKLVDHLIAAGVKALIANAGTSEFYTLTDAERYRAAEVVMEQAAGRLPVLVGACTTGTRLGVEIAQHARNIGAAGLMVMAPFYAPKPLGQVVRHFAAISDVGLPIMLYNQPAVTQQLLRPNELVELVNAANIPWIKLTTRHLEHIPILQDRLGTRVTLFEGFDDLAMASMANGAAGWVAGPSNAIPELAIELWRLVCVDRDLPKAQALNRRLVPLFDLALNEGVYNATLKEVCRLRGLPLGSVRLPNPELSPAQRDRVAAIVADLALMPVKH